MAVIKADPNVNPGPGYVWNTGMKRWVDVDAEITEPDLRFTERALAIERTLGRAFPPLGIGLRLWMLALKLMPDSWQAGHLGDGVIFAAGTPANGTLPQAQYELGSTAQEVGDVLQRIVDGLYGPITREDALDSGICSYAQMAAVALHGVNRRLFDVSVNGIPGAKGGMVRGVYRQVGAFRQYQTTAVGLQRTIPARAPDPNWHRFEYGWASQRLFWDYATTLYHTAGGTERRTVAEHLAGLVTAASRGGELKP